MEISFLQVGGLQVTDYRLIDESQMKSQVVTYCTLAFSNVLNVVRSELVTLQRNSQEKNMKGKEAENR